MKQPAPKNPESAKEAVLRYLGEIRADLDAVIEYVEHTPTFDTTAGVELYGRFEETYHRYRNGVIFRMMEIEESPSPQTKTAPAPPKLPDPTPPAV